MVAPPSKMREEKGDKTSQESGAVRRIALTVENDPELFVPSSGIIKSTPVSLLSSSSSSLSSKKATVSLNDCLACSGCVTSAETILIQEQSTSKLVSKLKYLQTPSSEQMAIDADDPSKPEELLIVTISPNSIASIANRLSIGAVNCFNLLSKWLKSLGVHIVCDAAVGGDIALIEAREEFIKRYQSHRENSMAKAKAETVAAAQATTGASSSKPSVRVVGMKKNPNWIEPPTTSAYSSKRFLPLSSQTPVPFAQPIQVTSPIVPVLTSNCPGWVCFAEKKHPEVLQYISSTKSPQQIIGSILKDIIYAEGNHDVFHVSVQPCFDKKLEASRLDFYHESIEYKEVDLVLSTTELMDFLIESSVVIPNIDDREGTLSEEKRVVTYLESLSGRHGSSSSDSGSGNYRDIEILFQSAIRPCEFNLKTPITS